MLKQNPLMCHNFPSVRMTVTRQYLLPGNVSDSHKLKGGKKIFAIFYYFY